MKALVFRVENFGQGGLMARIGRYAWLEIFQGYVTDAHQIAVLNQAFQAVPARRDPPYPTQYELACENSAGARVASQLYPVAR